MMETRAFDLVPFDGRGDRTLLSLLEALSDEKTGNDGDAGVFGSVCESLVDAGIPLWRAAFQLENLHPVYYGYCLHWMEGEAPGTIERTHAFAESPDFLASPYMASLRCGGRFRQKLSDPEAMDIPLLKTLRSRGATEMIAHIVSERGNLPPGVSWTTTQAGGFTDDQADFLFRLGPLLAPHFVAAANRQTVSAVLNTYVGKGPARAVQSGIVRRGEVEEVDAVIVMTDMRGFTAASAGRTHDETLVLLSDYCEAVTGAVMDLGGDVLKFVGDGILSIFEVERPEDLADRALDALAAVRRAQETLAKRPQPIDVVAVLHAGIVAYGNVGARTRLDFTVIGDAVNLTSRLEAIAKQEGEPIVLSRPIAMSLGGDVRRLGSFDVRGLSGPIDLFVPVR